MTEDAPLILFIGHPSQAASALLRLAACGYRTETAVDGSAGVLAAMTLAPHAVLIELDQACLDGLRIAHTLRSIPDLWDIALLAYVTPEAMLFGASRVAELFDGLLPPAAADAELQRAIGEALERRRNARKTDRQAATKRQHVAALVQR